METLKEVSLVFPETKQPIKEHPEQKCLKKQHSIQRGKLFFLDMSKSKEVALHSFLKQELF